MSEIDAMVRLMKMLISAIAVCSFDPVLDLFWICLPGNADPNHNSVRIKLLEKGARGMLD